MLEAFENDSFFTLSQAGQTGLLVLSGLLSAGMLALAWWLGRSIAWVLWVCVAFWLFLWLSPQVYYTYYLFLFDGLPVQVVVKWPPLGLEALRFAVAFEHGESLRGIGLGALFWGMLAVSGFRRFRRRS
ncbi:MAG: hypothetical protein AAGE80_16990 [Pseudomonadota bacterium]